jgi:DNA-binding transcriptional LysR family regulator
MLTELQTFLLVAEHGSFSGAARALGVPKSTVSRRVGRLEDELGLALLIRSSRSFVLSEDGQALRARARPALRELGDVLEDLGDRDSELRGELSLSCSIDLAGSRWLADLLAGFGGRHPGVQVRLRIANRRVDLLEEGIDLAFRIHDGPISDREDLMARSLGRLCSSLYASPGYLAEHPAPTTLEDLVGHRCIAHVRAFAEVWPGQPSMVVDDFGPAGVLAAAGAGVAALPEFVAAPWVDAGELVPLELGWPSPETRLALVWLRSRHMAPRLRAFLDMASKQASRTPWLRRPSGRS